MVKSKKWYESQKYEDKAYPNSSLVEVIAEARFPVNLSIGCHIDRFHEQIRKDFPKVILAQNKIEPDVFLSSDENSRILLSSYSFSYHTIKYDGHKKFANKFTYLTDTLKSAYEISNLDRIGWRYINIIPFLRKNGDIPIQDFLNFGLDIPLDIPKKYRYMNIAFEIPADVGSIIIRISPVRRKIDGNEALILDIDYGITKNLKIDKIESYLLEAHKCIRGLFEILITEKYRRFLRGETI